MMHCTCIEHFMIIGVYFIICGGKVHGNIIKTMYRFIAAQLKKQQLLSLTVMVYGDIIK